jgi:hypothetical protein
VPNTETPPPDDPGVFIEEEDLIPLSSLSEEERERLRIERERILDMLEEEERMEQSKSEGKEITPEQRRELLEKRKEAAKVEVEKLKAAKALQKKMGKALLRGLSEDREKEEKAQKKPLTQNMENKETPLAKKRVAFADVPHESSDRDRTGAQKDTASSKAPRTNRQYLVARRGSHPMKMEVVERPPAHIAKMSQPNAPKQDLNDASLPKSSARIVTEHGNSDAIHRGKDEPQQGEEAAEGDRDAAQTRREIALEYSKKRGTIGAQVSKAISTHSEAGDEWNQPVCVL